MIKQIRLFERGPLEEQLAQLKELTPVADVISHHVRNHVIQSGMRQEEIDGKIGLINQRLKELDENERTLQHLLNSGFTILTQWSTGDYHPGVVLVLGKSS